MQCQLQGVHVIYTVLYFTDLWLPSESCRITEISKKIKVVLLIQMFFGGQEPQLLSCTAIGFDLLQF